MKLVIEIDLDASGQSLRTQVQAQLMSLIQVVLEPLPPNTDLRLPLVTHEELGSEIRLAEAATLEGDRAIGRMLISRDTFDSTLGKPQGNPVEVVAVETTFDKTGVSQRILDRVMGDDISQLDISGASKPYPPSQIL